MTELEAVNLMLECIGESPVSALPSTLPEAILAQTILTRTSRQVQMSGYGFNTEYEYEVSLSGVDNSLTIPANVLRIDLSCKYGADVSIVGSKFYNKTTHNYDLSDLANDGKVKCDVVWFRSWTNLPEYAQNYIAIKAGRILARRAVTSDVLEQFTAQDEMDALLLLNESDSTETDYNLFNNNPDSWYMRGGY